MSIDFVELERRCVEKLTAAGGDAAHDLEPIRRVVANARRLAATEGARLEIVLPAAWLHDCVTVPKDSPQRATASRLAAAQAVAWLREWGWPMGPMRLIDEVGVDVTDFIFDEMQHYYPDRFTATTVCKRMLAARLRGRKNGESSGFYSYTGGQEALNAAMAPFAPAAKATIESAVLAEKLNGVMIDETKRVLAEGVLKTPDEADLALLLGAGFPAFRGGLMRHAKSMGLF